MPLLGAAQGQDTGLLPARRWRGADRLSYGQERDSVLAGSSVRSVNSFLVSAASAEGMETLLWR